MNRVIKKLSSAIFGMAMVVATVFINSTCSYKLYQEELPEELKKLRKHV